ncbi:MAG: TA system antitoxin ParD family protein [Steroidobacteraceae bacterium]
MSQSVKLSGSLISEARSAIKGRERSVSAQVEYWAKMGQAIESILRVPQAASLRHQSKVPAIFAGLGSADSPAGRRRVRQILKSRPFPHYTAHPRKAGLLIRIDADGKRSTGQFINRRFEPITENGAR